MKKMCVFLLGLACMSGAFAQKPSEVCFYGIDFSEVKVLGVDEQESEFMDAFKRINVLFLSEPEKYDVGKFLGLCVLETDIDIANEQVEVLADKSFWNRASSGIADSTMGHLLSQYPSTDVPGLILVAIELNKSTQTGKYEIVAFDGKTKDIIWRRTMEGSAGGYGLRNYWAGSVHTGLLQESRQMLFEEQELDLQKRREQAQSRKANRKAKK